MTGEDEDVSGTHRSDYPNVAEWLDGVDSEHFWARLLDTKRHPDVQGPTVADMALMPLEVLIVAVRAAAPRGLAKFVDDRFRDPDLANVLSARLELLCAAHLAIRQIPFDFGGTGEADLTWHPGTDDQGWMEIHRGAFSVFDAMQQEIEVELAQKGATLDVRLDEWPLDIKERNRVLARISKAINNAVATGLEQVVKLPELCLGAVGLIRPQGQQFFKPSRVRVQHGSYMPADNYLNSFARRLAYKVNVEKAGQARKGSWDQRTILLIDVSTAHLALLLGQDGLAAWLERVPIEWEDLPFAGMAVCFSNLHSIELRGVCRYHPGLAAQERQHLETMLTALGLPTVP